MKIGIGVTTDKPNDVSRYTKYLPEGCLFKINSDHTTISRDKNKLIKELYDEGAEIIFIFDDDTFPIKHNWEKFFIAASKRTGVHHFVLGNDEHLQMIGFENGLNYYRKGTGCMLFLTRQVIEKVGYLNNRYGRYGFEHATYSHRIHRSGLTPSWYCSVEGWEEYVYSWDLQKEEAHKHNFIKEEWATPEEKEKYIEQNQSLYYKEMHVRNVYLDYEQIKPQKKGRSKVLYFSLEMGDTTDFQRIHGVLPYITHDDFWLIDISFQKNFNESLFKDVSILIFQRPFTHDHVKLIQLAKQCGVTVILDYDDDVLNVDMYNPTYYMYQQFLPAIHDCLKMADEVWVTTESIKDTYKHFNTHIIPNAHNDYIFPTYEKLPFKTNKKVIYRGGMSHKADVYSYGEMLVETINNNLDWNFLFMGDRYEWIEQRTKDNHHIIQGMSISDYYNYVYNQNPSAFIFPLANTKFNKGKSNICYLEATYVGAAFFGVTDLPEFNKPGVIDLKMLPSTIKGEHYKFMAEQNKLAWEYICDELLVSNINQLRVDRILANL